MSTQTIVGTFVAQQFKLISLDPNTIFRVFVCPDRLIFLPIGVATEEAAIAAKVEQQAPAVGPRSPDRASLPTWDEVQAAVASTAKGGLLSAGSRQVPLDQVAKVHLRFTGWKLRQGLTITLVDGKTIPLRFLTDGDQQAADELCAHVLDTRYTAG